MDASAETLYVNKGESAFTTAIANTNDIALTVNNVADTPELVDIDASSLAGKTEDDIQLTPGGFPIIISAKDILIIFFYPN